MSLRAACLLLCAVTVAAVDLTSPQYFTLKAVKPGDAGSSHDTLEIQTIFDKQDVIKSVPQMVLFTSQPGSSEVSSILCVVMRLGPLKQTEVNSYEMSAILDDPADGKSRLNAVWNNESDGYCRVYTAMVVVRDLDNQDRPVNKTITVGGYPGTSCSLDQADETPETTLDETPETTLDETPEETNDESEAADNIQSAFPDATPGQQQQILDKINSLDESTYDVSDIYQGRVYIATMKDTNFELDNMNELCKSAGGYLVELDSPEEEWFVRDFLKTLNNYRYFTGANDVDSEGNFVYYNSKKPVANVVWQQGEPNNGGGNENCVEILKRGLNDQSCSKKRGYICEIPLLEDRS